MQPMPSSDTELQAVQPTEPATPSDVPLQSTPQQGKPASTETSSRSVPTNSTGLQSWGMTPGDRRFVFVMVSVLFVLMVVNWIKIVAWHPAPLVVDRPSGKEYRYVVDVNTATWVEWMQLDGIGETMARRIVAYREEHGPFESVDEVDQIPGVGPKTFARIREQLVCDLPQAD